MLDNIIYIIDSIIGFFKSTYHYSDDRRNSELYKKKREIVKFVWIVSGLIMLLFLNSPHFLGIITVLAMFTTFIAFMILDETYYPRDEE